MIDYLVDGIAEGIHRVADVLDDASYRLRGWAEALDYWTLDGIGKTVESAATDPWTHLDEYLRNQGIRTVPSDPLATPVPGPNTLGADGVGTWPLPGDKRITDATGGPPDF